ATPALIRIMRYGNKMRRYRWLRFAARTSGVSREVPTWRCQTGRSDGLRRTERAVRRAEPAEPAWTALLVVRRAAIGGDDARSTRLLNRLATGRRCAARRIATFRRDLAQSLGSSGRVRSDLLGLFPSGLLGGTLSGGGVDVRTELEHLIFAKVCHAV